MARLFDDSVPEYLRLGSSPVSGAPLTMSCWVYTDVSNISQSALFMGSVSSRQWFVLFLRDTGNTVRFGARDGTGGETYATTTTTFSTDTWHHICAVAHSATDRRVFLDGGGKGTQTTSETPALNALTVVGAFKDTVLGQRPFSGRVAEATIWNVAFSDAEVALLAKGLSAFQLHPEAVAFYVPLIRDADMDYITGTLLTLGGTPTVADHPPTIIYPAMPFVASLAAAAAAEAGQTWPHRQHPSKNILLRL